MKNHRWLKNPGWYCGSNWKHHRPRRPLEEVTNLQHHVVMSSCHHVIINLHYNFHAIMSSCWVYLRPSRPLEEVTTSHHQSENRSDCRSDKICDHQFQKRSTTIWDHQYDTINHHHSHHHHHIHACPPQSLCVYLEWSEENSIETWSPLYNIKFYVKWNSKWKLCPSSRRRPYFLKTLILFARLLTKQGWYSADWKRMWTSLWCWSW